MRRGRWVSVCLDVEDPVNALADDAALDLARLVSDAGVRGSFCVTGEKCRKLVDRGRTDVIEALKPHCLGLHTDTHSFHPTTMELLADLSYEEGCAAALAAESRGREAFVAAFGREPAFWGGAGNTWSPEIPFALTKLSIPAYVYALTDLPRMARHRFNGCFAIPQDFSISESDWADDARAATSSEWVLNEIHAGHQCVFVGHPTRFRYDRFWDFGFASGVTPDPIPLAELLPEEAYQRSLRNLAAFLRQLPNVIGIDEAIALPWTFRPPTEGERAHFREQTAENISSAATWPIHYPGLNPQRIIEKTWALVDTVEVAELG